MVVPPAGQPAPYPPPRHPVCVGHVRAPCNPVGRNLAAFQVRCRPLPATIGSALYPAALSSCQVKCNLAMSYSSPKVPHLCTLRPEGRLPSTPIPIHIHIHIHHIHIRIHIYKGTSSATVLGHVIEISITAMLSGRLPAWAPEYRAGKLQRGVLTKHDFFGAWNPPSVLPPPPLAVVVVG